MEKLTHRTIHLNGVDKELQLSKVAKINVSEKEFIYLDKLPDGTWRLCYTGSTIPDITKLRSMEVVRKEIDREALEEG